jgi:hypothetical protein
LFLKAPPRTWQAGGWGIGLPLAFLCAYGPSIQRISDQDGRMLAVNDLRIMVLAMHSHGDTHRRLPAAAIADAKGQPLLSWRVSLLPFVEQNELHRFFKLDEAWDGPNNRALLDKNPSCYLNQWQLDQQGSVFQVFVGPGTAFEPGKKLQLSQDFPDGVSNTILIAESRGPVPWSKPEDIPYAADRPLPPLGRPYTVEGTGPYYPLVTVPGFHVAMADGSVRFVRADVSEEVLRAAIVRNDGKIPDWPRLRGFRDTWP